MTDVTPDSLKATIEAQLGAFNAQVSGLQSAFDAQVKKLSKVYDDLNKHTGSAASISAAAVPATKASFVTTGVSTASIGVAAQLKAATAQLFDANQLAEKALQDYFDGHKPIAEINAQFKNIYGQQFDLKQQLKDIQNTPPTPPAT